MFPSYRLVSARCCWSRTCISRAITDLSIDGSVPLLNSVFRFTLRAGDRIKSHFWPSMHLTPLPGLHVHHREVVGKEIMEFTGDGEPFLAELLAGLGLGGKDR